MTNSTFLSRLDLRSLTDKSRSSAQVRVLRAMAIEHKVRPDGSIAVLHGHIAKVFDGNPTEPTSRKTREAGPNWAAI